MREVKRLLKPDGLAIISTPNKQLYSDDIDYKNEFHIHEFYLEEFRDFLNEYFQSIAFFGHRVYPASYIWTIEETDQPIAEHQITWSDDRFVPVDEDQKQAFYVLALCSNRAATSHPAPSLMLDLSERASRERARLLLLRESEQRQSAEAYEVERGRITARLDEARINLKAQLMQRRDFEQQLARVNASLKLLQHQLEKSDSRHAEQTRKKLRKLRRDLAAGSAALARVIATEEAESARPIKIAPLHGKVDVIVLPVIPWEFRFQRPQHLATQFARSGHRVFYLETHFHRVDASAHTRQLARLIYGVRMPGPPGLTIYEGEIDERRLGRWIQALEIVRSRVQIEDAVCLVELPFWTPLALAARALWGWRVIYDCMDDIAGFGNLSESVLDQETWLIGASDLVLATSRSLHAKVAPHAQRTLLLPNATDFDHFNQVPAAHPLNNVPRPIIGYYGALSHWFDARLVRRAAKARPEWQFVLIGHVQANDISSLGRLPNVTLLGEQAYADLPAFLHEFDVAIIPFRRTSLTKATNPVKFFEYLSVGLPVVATALPELEPYAALYYPVRDETEFVPQIEAALAENDSALTQSRLEVARRNTWESRYAALRDEIARIKTSLTIYPPIA
jgi:glycosyltransferase involved in cell wall biosynthesis